MPLENDWMLLIVQIKYCCYCIRHRHSCLLAAIVPGQNAFQHPELLAVHPACQEQQMLLMLMPLL
jgi:hypothetical protein